MEEGENKESIEDYVREGNVDEVDYVVWENNYKGNIKYDYLGKSPG